MRGMAAILPLKNCSTLNIGSYGVTSANSADIKVLPDI
jgi:hypothetical protein